MLTKRRFLWPLVIAVVGWLQLRSHQWGQPLIPKFLQSTSIRRFDDSEELRFDVLGHEILNNLSDNRSVPVSAKEMINDILSISRTNDIPLAELEHFQAELYERFQGPVSCETLEWLWKRAAALSARSARYTTKYRPQFEVYVLYRMDCSISDDVRRAIDFREEQKQRGL